MADKNAGKIPAAQLLAYGALSLPLAMAALPIYVHIPKLYADLGLSLSWLGAVLLAVRALDAFIDPLLGRLSDALPSRKRKIAFACVPMALGVAWLFAPQVLSSALNVHLIPGLALTTLGFSAITIAYHAWGAEWSTDAYERTRITTFREALGLLGVLLASALPVVLTDRFGLATGYFYFSLAFVICLALFCGITLVRANERPRRRTQTITPFRQLWADVSFRKLLAVFALNGIAAAIPATLVLFFISDVISANDWQKEFLLIYFVAGAVAAPLWMRASVRFGKRRAWAASMIVATFTFCWAYFLGAGDRLGFLAVCALSGIALGADLTLPPSMLADVIGRSAQPDAAGGYFGVWTMVSKLNFALAAGLALPILGWLGYVPSAAASGAAGNLAALTFAYSALPCALKLAALAFLVSFKDPHHA